MTATRTRASAVAAVTVAEVMVRHPKVLPADASVGEVRAVLADDHVHMVLLTEGQLLRGTLTREDLPAVAAGTEPALNRSQLTGRTVAPDAPGELMLEELVERGTRRLAAVDQQGRLLGLLCLKRGQTGFCSDADAAARGCAAVDHHGATQRPS
jgi:CBS-domain-containing membrane protein